MEAFYRRLRRLRKSRGMTMTAFARMIGVPPSTYRTWEYGGAIQGEPYLKMAQVLEISLYELFAEEKPRSKDIFDLVEKIDVLSKQLKKELLPFI